jgi:CxxH/CxxC protein (TIGR04129 family)
MYVVCKEHIEMAIDEFIDEYLQVPDLCELDNITFTEWSPPEECHFCSACPQYLVI